MARDLLRHIWCEELESTGEDLCHTKLLSVQITIWTKPPHINRWCNHRLARIWKHLVLLQEKWLWKVWGHRGLKRLDAGYSDPWVFDDGDVPHHSVFDSAALLLHPVDQWVQKNSLRTDKPRLGTHSLGIAKPCSLQSQRVHPWKSVLYLPNRLRWNGHRDSTTLRQTSLLPYKVPRTVDTKRPESVSVVQKTNSVRGWSICRERWQVFWCGHQHWWLKAARSIKIVRVRMELKKLYLKDF